jgi:hypothetical protein
MTGTGWPPGIIPGENCPPRNHFKVDSQVWLG